MPQEGFSTVGVTSWLALLVRHLGGPRKAVTWLVTPISATGGGFPARKTMERGLVRFTYRADCEQAGNMAL